MTGRITLTDDLLRRTLEARAIDAATAEALAGPFAADVAVEAARTPQERRSWWHGAGWLKPSIATGAVALAAVVGFVVIGRSSPPAVRDLQVGVGSMETRVLDGGRYRSEIFDPSVELTIPGGRWVATANLPAELELRAFRPGQPETESGVLTILRIGNLMNGACGYQGPSPWPATGGDPQFFMVWLRSQLPANLGAVTPITIDGVAGLQVEVQTSTDLRQTCDYGFLLTDAGTADKPRWVEIPIDGRPVRLGAIEVSGRLIVVMTAGPWTNQFGSITSDADAMIASMTFPTGP